LGRILLNSRNQTAPKTTRNMMSYQLNNNLTFYGRNQGQSRLSTSPVLSESSLRHESSAGAAGMEETEDISAPTARRVEPAHPRCEGKAADVCHPGRSRESRRETDTSNCCHPERSRRAAASCFDSRSRIRDRSAHHEAVGRVAGRNLCGFDEGRSGADLPYCVTGGRSRSSSLSVRRPRA
jgi:hypothetical protein